MQTTPSTDAFVPKTSPTIKTRIEALDVIRGTAVLGILAVNVDGFAAPMSASLNPLTWMFPNQGWTAMSFWFMDSFFHEKFVALFSMLFGISLFLVGGERGDKQRGRLLARRLCVLFLFGMLHGFGIWWGDILSLYAVTGALMFFCRSWQPRTLLVAGLVLFLAASLSRLPTAALPFATPAAKMQAAARLHPDPGALARRKAAVALTLAEAKASWRGAFEVNVRQYLKLLSGNPNLIPSTLGLMMIGLSLFKSGYLAGSASAASYRMTLLAAAGALMLVAWLC